MKQINLVHEILEQQLPPQLKAEQLSGLILL